MWEETSENVSSFTAESRTYTAIVFQSGAQKVSNLNLVLEVMKTQSKRVKLQFSVDCYIKSTVYKVFVCAQVHRPEHDEL